MSAQGTNSYLYDLHLPQQFQMDILDVSMQVLSHILHRIFDEGFDKVKLERAVVEAVVLRRH